MYLQFFGLNKFFPKTFSNIKLPSDQFYPSDANADFTQRQLLFYLHL